MTEAWPKAKVLKSKPTSCPLDPQPTSLLEFLEDLLPTLTDVINFPLSCGTFPLTLRSAVLKRVLKKASLDPNDLKNFQPVSNLSFVSKITEKIVLQQLPACLTEYSGRRSVRMRWGPKIFVRTNR